MGDRIKTIDLHRLLDEVRAVVSAVGESPIAEVLSAVDDLSAFLSIYECVHAWEGPVHHHVTGSDLGMRCAKCAQWLSDYDPRATDDQTGGCMGYRWPSDGDGGEP